jgi:glycine betaine/choline ABC-type transport system substrate-binding protein
LAQTQATLAKYGVKTLCGYAALDKRDPAAASLCVESEFQSRDDGFPGVKKAYGFSPAGSSEHLLDTAVVYTELGKGGTCNFGEVFTTDGRVASLKLNVVQDDKKFFPIYSPALSVRSDVAKKYPGPGGAVQADRQQAQHRDAPGSEQGGQRGWAKAPRGGRDVDAVPGVHQATAFPASAC